MFLDFLQVLFGQNLDFGSPAVDLVFIGFEEALGRFELTRCSAQGVKRPDHGAKGLAVRLIGAALVLCHIVHRVKVVLLLDQLFTMARDAFLSAHLLAVLVAEHFDRQANVG